MERKSQIQALWRECFPDDSREWLQMFFAQSYSDDCAVTLEEDGVVVSSLLLQPYAMTFHGEKVAVGYIYGAGTLRKFRGKGYMSRLVREALMRSRERGDMLSMLIPATPRLYRYYSRFGFSAVFYSDVRRFTPVHKFIVSGEYVPVSVNHRNLYEAYARMMGRRACCVQHSREQFLTVIDDAGISGGVFVAVADSVGRICAMGWAVPSETDGVAVTELLAENIDARNAVLAQIQKVFPDCPLAVYEPAGDAVAAGSLVQTGMARMVHPDQALAIIARNYPQLKVNVRVTDAMLPDNNATYYLDGGEVSISPHGSEGRRLNLDVNIATLTAILFSRKETGNVIGLPAMRPHASLMLS